MYGKLVVIINGRGGVGKDTLCQALQRKCKVRVISSVDPIKAAARQLGWTGSKEDADRSFLHDLKMLSTEYNNFPNVYMIQKCAEFFSSDDEVLFINIREPDAIKTFVDLFHQVYHKDIATLLIKRKLVDDHVFGNAADDDVENYPYDLIYENDYPVDAAKADFLHFFGTSFGVWY